MCLPARREPSKGAIWLDVNGERKQSGDLSQMIWDMPNQIEFLSALFELKAGDLIFSGTPSGVGPIKKGDQLKGHVDGIGDLVVTSYSQPLSRRLRNYRVGLRSLGIAGF